MRLQAMNRPLTAALRKAVVQDIAKLKAAPDGHSGCERAYRYAACCVDKLPLAAETRPVADSAVAPVADASTGNSRGFWRVWADLKQLVRAAHDRADVPLLTPAQTFFLRENLAAIAYRAYGAAIGDIAVDLKTAREWLAR
jgi:uroporphyrin-3 C-methyltransferase